MYSYESLSQVCRPLNRSIRVFGIFAVLSVFCPVLFCKLHLSLT